MNKNNLEKFEKMKVAGNLAARTLDMITEYVKPNIATNKIDKLCYEFIRDNGGHSAPLYYRGAKACIMVYDVTDRLSFRKLRDWMAAIYHQNEDPLVLLLGNKVDCVNRRVVSKEEGEQYAAMIGALYFETSAKTGEGIELASDKMIEQLIMRKKEENEDTDDCPIKIENSKSFSLTRKLNTNCCS